MDSPEQTSSPPAASPVAVVAEVVLWWAVAYAVWLMSLSTAPLQELLVGATAALPCGVAAYGARRATGDRWVLRLRWLRPALHLPVVLLTDTFTVLSAALTGRPVGRFERVPTGAVDDVPPARSERAVATFWVSLTPGSYVVDADPASGELMVHSLPGPGPSMADIVSRDAHGGDG